MASLEQIEILLVEDSAEDAEMTLRALRKNHLANRVHWVKDGEEALAYLFNSQAPKLVMLDLKMPKVDGIEVLRQLKADATTRHIPIIVLSAHAMRNDREMALGAGGDEFDTKPVHFEQLLVKIAALLAKAAIVQ